MVVPLSTRGLIVHVFSVVPIYDPIWAIHYCIPLTPHCQSILCNCCFQNNSSTVYDTFKITVDVNHLVVYGHGAIFKILDIWPEYGDVLQWMISYIHVGDWHLLKNYQEVLVKIFWDGGSKTLAKNIQKNVTLTRIGNCSNFKHTHRFLLQVHEAIFMLQINSWRGIWYVLIILVSGKRVRGVPILLKEETYSNICKLAAYSKARDETFLFARSTGGCDTPICTSAVMQLANHMGHDLATHREYYRLPYETMLLSKVSKILHLADKGQFPTNSGKKLSDIHITSEAEAGSDTVRNTDESPKKMNSRNWPTTWGMILPPITKTTDCRTRSCCYQRLARYFIFM